MTTNLITIFDGTDVELSNFEEIHVYSENCSLVMVDVTYMTGMFPGWVDSIPMIYWSDSKTAFCPKDWQSIPSEFTLESVSEIDWIDLITGDPTVIVDGIPRLLPFKPMGRPRKNPVLTDDQGNEYFEAVVAAQGTTGRLYPPAAWIGHRVRVTRSGYDGEYRELSRK